MFQEVIGWYSCRRNSTLRMSLKERTLHKHLEARFCPQKPDHFLFFMCVDTASTQCSTHTLDHCFFTVSREPGWEDNLNTCLEPSSHATLHLCFLPFFLPFFVCFVFIEKNLLSRNILSWSWLFQLELDFWIHCCFFSTPPWFIWGFGSPEAFLNAQQESGSLWESVLLLALLLLFAQWCKRITTVVC